MKIIISIIKNVVFSLAIEVIEHIILGFGQKWIQAGRMCEMKSNFEVCCESVETMAQIIDIMKCGWTKEQIINWLKQPFIEVEEGRKISICYLSDIPSRIRNARIILENMEAGHISQKHENGFTTGNAEYRFIDCRHPEEYMGVYADQAIIDFRDPMRGIAEIITARSCVPKDRIIDDRCIDVVD